MAEVASSVGEADELTIPLVIIVIAIGLVFASLYVGYIAPVLLAEVLLGGVLAYAWFKHLKSDERPFWLTGVLRHTLLPFALTALLVSGSGWVMARYAPGARSIGQVIERASMPGPVR